MSYSISEHTLKPSIQHESHHSNSIKSSVSENLKATQKYFNQKKINNTFDTHYNKQDELHSVKKTPQKKQNKVAEHPKPSAYKKDTQQSQSSSPERSTSSSNEDITDTNEVNKISQEDQSKKPILENEINLKSEDENINKNQQVLLPISPLIALEEKKHSHISSLSNIESEVEQENFTTPITDDLFLSKSELIAAESTLEDTIAEPQSQIASNNTTISDFKIDTQNHTNSEQINITNLSENTSEVTLDFNNNQNIQNFSNFNTDNISITKSSQTQIIHQLPMRDNMTLNIIKDQTNPNKIGINLEPAGMGEVELVIENNKDNAVIAVIRSDKPEILEQLRKETASLEQYLTEAGLDLGGNGLGFEQKSQNESQNENNSDKTHLAATLSQISATNTQQSKLSTQEQLYINLDQQSVEIGLDIRL